MGFFEYIGLLNGIFVAQEWVVRLGWYGYRWNQGSELSLNVPSENQTETNKQHFLSASDSGTEFWSRFSCAGSQTGFGANICKQGVKLGMWGVVYHLGSIFLSLFQWCCLFWGIIALWGCPRYFGQICGSLWKHGELLGLCVHFWPHLGYRPVSKGSGLHPGAVRVQCW